MICHRVHISTIWSRRHEFHLLTYAEEGFAPLNLHTRDTGITKDQLVAFCDLVNDRNEPGSLFPLASVSAVPRYLIRDLMDAATLCQSIEDFYLMNAERIGAKKLLLDFRTPNVSPFVNLAIEMSLQSPDLGLIDEVLVLDDKAET